MLLMEVIGICIGIFAVSSTAALIILGAVELFKYLKDEGIIKTKEKNNE